MNKVTTINLNGRAYQLEEGGEAVLRKYLETAAAKLAGNPDKDEIMADFEQAIADKFDQKLNSHKNVVTEREIEEIIAAMGPVEGANAEGTGAGTDTDDSTTTDAAKTANSSGGSASSDPKTGAANSGGYGGSASGGSSGASSGSGSSSSSGSSSDSGSGSSGNAGAPKRLYRIPAGEWIMGVCNGLAAYFNVDVTLMRIVWILLTIFTHGFWILAYIILAFVMPPVRSEEQFAEAHGWTTRPPLNANDFIEETKKRYAEWRAELEKMHDEHKAKMAEQHGGAKNNATAAGGTTAGATAADVAADASAVGTDAAATAKQAKEDMKAWAKKMKIEMKQKKQQMKQEWRAHSREWRDDWRNQERRYAYRYNGGYGASYGTGAGGPGPNASAYGPQSDAYDDYRYGRGYGISRAIFGFFAVIVSIVLLAVAVAWITALYTLIKYGTVFGYAIGAGHPLWISLVFMVAAFYVVTIPFRLLLQHAWGHARYQSGWSEFGRTIVFLTVCAILIYTARELFPQVNNAWNTTIAWLNSKI